MFTRAEEFDHFVNFLLTNESLKGLTWHVRNIFLENTETHDVGFWKRCKAKDGTSRMILELKEINGIKYHDIMYTELLAYADGMADAECCQVPKGKKIQKQDTVCYFAAKEGKVS